MIGIRKAIAYAAACLCGAKYTETPDVGHHPHECVRYVKGGRRGHIQTHPIVRTLAYVYGKRSHDVAQAIQRIWKREDEPLDVCSACASFGETNPKNCPPSHEG